MRLLFVPEIRVFTKSLTCCQLSYGTFDFKRLSGSVVYDSIIFTDYLKRFSSVEWDLKFAETAETTWEKCIHTLCSHSLCSSEEHFRCYRFQFSCNMITRHRQLLPTIDRMEKSFNWICRQHSQLRYERMLHQLEGCAKKF